jgi:hypothetical protein
MVTVFLETPAMENLDTLMGSMAMKVIDSFSKSLTMALVILKI